MNTIDTTLATTPLEDRPRWPAAQTAIISGRAMGIVTTAYAGAAALDDWLGEHQAFLSQVATMPTVAERAAR
ncbi:hypothetical protein ACWDA7_30655 [Streptomyces sp. NPDC001156]